MSEAQPCRGDVWRVDLDPTRGREQRGTRPCLVVSDDLLSQGPAELVICVPITSKAKGIATHVAVSPPEGGLTQESFVVCEQLRTVSKLRLRGWMGSLMPPTLRRVERCLRVLLDL